jgi:hypothetical protein
MSNTKDEVIKLNNNSISTDTELTCPICFDSIDSSINIIKTECNHCFHSNCFLKNAAHNGFNCPMCRNELAKSPEDDCDDEDEDEYDDEDEDEDEYDNDDEDEQYILNSVRWLFMRAENEPIDITDDDIYDEYIREATPEALNISINEIAEKIIQKGVTYNQLVALLVLPDKRNTTDLIEYNSRSLFELDNIIQDIVYSNVN